MIHFENGKLTSDSHKAEQRKAKRLILIIRFFLFFVLLLASMALMLLGLIVALTIVGC